MDKKTMSVYGICFLVIQTLISTGLFVTHQQMSAYAVSKDTMAIFMEKLNTMDKKIDAILIRDSKH